MKTSSLAATGRNGTQLKLLHSPIPRELSMVDLFSGSPEDPPRLARLSLSDLTRRFTTVKSFFSGAFVKTIQNIVNIVVAWVMDNSWSKQAYKE